MNSLHVLSDEVLAEAASEIAQGYCWLAYNTACYFLERGDVVFFSTREEAKEFAVNNVSDADSFCVIEARSIQHFMLQFPYELSLLNQTPIDQSLNNIFMNQQNLDYLKNNLKYMGFGEKLGDKLESQMRKGEPDFQLRFDAEFNKKPFVAVLNFRKSDQSGMYFFNSYHATLQRNDGEILDQAFYVNKGKGITAKEAYNLLEGRAVYKEMTNKDGQTYHAWQEIDFDKRDKHNNHEMKQYHENYGYDLKATLSKFDIREVKEPDLAEVLISSLQKGNLQAVAFEREGSVAKIFVEAAPQYKTINIYDANLKMLSKEQKVHIMSPEARQERINEIAQDAKAADKAIDKKQDNKLQKGKQVKPEKGNGLLPKKRKGQKNGMSLH
jgi:hypothetical protein